MSNSQKIKTEIEGLLTALTWDIDPDPIYQDLESKIKELGEEGKIFLLEKIKNDPKNLLSVLTLLGNLRVTESINELKAICASNKNIDDCLESAISLAKMDCDFGYEELYRLFTESNVLPVDWIDEIAEKLKSDRAKELAILIRRRRK